MHIVIPECSFSSKLLLSTLGLGIFARNFSTFAGQATEPRAIYKGYGFGM
jgi:hypothetical protein